MSRFPSKEIRDMRLHLLSLRPGKGAYKSPCVSIATDWLAEMGFVPRALVEVMPEPGGVSFILRDENIPKYSDLVYETKARGGKLVQVYAGPVLGAANPCLLAGGLSVGDHLIARYQHGLIQIRKLPGASKLIPVLRAPSAKAKGGPVPRIRIYGEWLSDAGFTRGKLVTAAAGPGLITFRHCDYTMDEYPAAVKFARANKLSFVEISLDDNNAPVFEKTGVILEKAGFEVGEVLLAAYEYGLIKLRKIDLEGLGFQCQGHL